MTSFLVLAVVSALVDWYAVFIANRRLERIAKPAAMIFLILWYTTLLPYPRLAAGVWFLLGLVFSLAGDIFLMLDRKHFIKGLLSFLLAHLAYIVTFNFAGLIVNPPLLAFAVLIGFAGFLLVRRITASLRARGDTSLIPPVVIYAAILALTFWSTLTTFWRPDWPWAAPWVAAVGGGFFFLSDSLLAWDRFVAPLPKGRFWTMLTYHFAQMGLTLSVLVMALARGDFVLL